MKIELDPMPESWLFDQARRESRIEHHSPRMQWPVKKILNDSPLWNRHKLAREREERRTA
jgi:hypothetical protein